MSAALLAAAEDIARESAGRVSVDESKQRRLRLGQRRRRPTDGSVRLRERRAAAGRGPSAVEGEAV